MISRKTKSRVQIVVALLSLAAPLLWSTAAETANSEDANFIGDWRGQSTCVVKPSSCQDEDSLYHITLVTDRPGWFSLRGDKIVAGKAVTMGTVACSYDASHKSLTCDFAHQILEFTVQGNQMRGTMKLEDGSLWRKLSLKKVE